MARQISRLGLAWIALAGALAAGCGGDDSSSGDGGSGGSGGSGGGTTTTTSTTSTTSTTTTHTGGGSQGGGGAAPECGDGKVDAGEECDDGPDNGDTKACKSDCTSQACGDGFVGPGEECDDGPDNADTNACKSDCTDQVCGDGFVGPGEGCDDGNNIDDDACNNSCVLASCGDGVVQAGEQCDDGNSDNTDSCTNACTTPACGDGFIQSGAGEQCDDGAANSNTAACLASCQTATCGDGFVQSGVEQCDLGAQNSNQGTCKLDCSSQMCGDGFTGPGEACDDGNASNADACLNTCNANVCGDGFVNGGVEACDDGNLTDADGCNHDCVVSGTPLWTTTWNNGQNDYASGVAVDAQGNVFIAGSTQVAGQGYNAVVKKYSPAGAELWSDIYNGPGNLDDEAFGVTVDAGGNVYVVGYDSTAAANQDIMVRRYSNAGALVWSTFLTSAGAAQDVGYGITTDLSGNIYVAGNLTIANQGADIWAAKLSPAAGAVVWQQTFNSGVNLNDYAFGIATDAAGDAYVTGAVANANGVSFDIWVRKFATANGNTLWTQQSGVAATNEFGLGICIDGTGAPIVAGTEFGAGQDLNVWGRKYTSAGATTWTLPPYNGNANGVDQGVGVDSDSSNNVIIVGEETTAGQGANVWVRKHNSSGTPLWTQTYNNGANLDDVAAGVAVDANNNIVVVGYETVGAGNANLWVRKYAP